LEGEFTFFAERNEVFGEMVVLFVSMFLQLSSNQTYTIMPFTLPELPYPKDALEPHLSAKTFEFHHGKHHNAYVTNLNNLIPNTEFEHATLEEIVTKTAGDASKAGFFNNAAQVWNHTFYWNCMKPDGGGEPEGKLMDKIKDDFGDYGKFKEAFKQAGVTQFGSGWAWLVMADGKLSITKTLNADLPVVHKQTPLLTMDVWEHAYYIDFQNRRPDYAQTFIDKLINWDFVSKNFDAAAK
jgi:superoxide dismutase, Fe-Mn family